MNSFTPAEDDRVLLSYQDGSMLNVEGKTDDDFQYHTIIFQILVFGWCILSFLTGSLDLDY